MTDRSLLTGSKALASERAWPQKRYRDQAQRDYFPRCAGLALGALAVGSVLYESDAAAGWWVLLVINGLAWPHVAFRLARRSRDPELFEHRNLLLDSVLIGMWAAVAQFSLLVSALILSMAWMDNIAVGGERLFLKGLAATFVGIGVGMTLAGPAWRPEPTLLQAVFCLPMLMIYPQLIGLWDHRINKRLHEKRRTLEKLSQLDGLAGVNNRQYWEHLARVEFNRARRYGLQCSLVLLDIDHFKEFNDAHGHVAGDEVIRRIGRVLLDSTRLEDPIGRYGGEEFAVILTGADKDASVAKAEAIRQAVSDESGAAASISISAGVAELTPETVDFTAWLERADQALYRAKAGGRNRVAE